MVHFFVSLFFVFLAVYLLQKKYSNTFVFLALSTILAIYYIAFTGNSPVETSSGLLILDIFEVFREQLTSSFSSVALSMLPIYGYSMYMDKIQASSVLGSIVAKPVSRAKNPYFVGVFIAIVICSVMRIAIVSAFAILALLFSTLYPAMLQAGLSKKTTISALFLGTCFDWGPADFVVAVVLGGADVNDLPGYFLNVSVRVLPFVILFCALITGKIMEYWDKKDGYIIGSDKPMSMESSSDIPPVGYAVLPLLPLLLIIIFSNVFFQNISISVVAAVLISLCVSFFTECIRKRNVLERTADLTAWLNGMGSGYANLFLMVASIQLFAGMLSKIGGFSWLIEVILQLGVNGWLMFFLLGVFVIFMAVLIGEPSAISAILAGPVQTAANSLGIPFYAAIFPLQTANAFRCLSIGTGPHIQYCSNYSGCTPLDIVKRCAIPCIIIYLSSFAGAYFIL